MKVCKESKDLVARANFQPDVLPVKTGIQANDDKTAGGVYFSQQAEGHAVYRCHE
jgi:hypothetical protein